MTIKSNKNSNTLSRYLTHVLRMHTNQSIPHVPNRCEAPISFEQEPFLFHHKHTPDSSIYHMFRAFRIKGTLDTDLWEKCLQIIVSRHTCLRTAIVEKNTRPFQIVSKSAIMPFRIVHAKSISRIQLRTMIRREVRKPFDFVKPPLLRSVLYDLEDQTYVFLIVIHHIIADGISIGILLNELSLLYQIHIQNIPMSISNPAIDYMDYASWQQEESQSSEYHTMMAYWKIKLQSPRPALRLPADFITTESRTGRGKRLHFFFSPATTREVETVSLKLGVTPFILLLAVYTLLLHRYTEQEDFIIGSPFTGRNHKNTFNSVGTFTSTLALCISIPNRLSFSNLIELIRETTMEAFQNRYVPFHRVIEALQPFKNLSRIPIIQNLFVYQNMSSKTLTIPGLDIKPISIDPKSSLFDCTLLIGNHANRLEGFWEYSTDIFHTKTIRRAAAHFRTLLKNVLENPSVSIHKCPMLSHTEFKHIVVDWNNTNVDNIPHSIVHHWFEEQAASKPHALAVEYEHHSLTYQELNKQANRIAHYLQKKKAGPETTIGICTGRTHEMIVGLLGILKSGSAFVPLDPNLPPARLKFMVKACGLHYILAQKSRDEIIKPLSIDILQLDDPTQLFSEPDTNPKRDILPQNPAYIIFTSGSTGQPKGVAISHYSLCNHLFWVHHVLYRHFLVPQTVPLYFDVSIKQILGPLTQGKPLWILSNEETSMPSAILKKLRSQSNIALNIPTSQWETILNQVEPEILSLYRSVIRALFLGAEPMHDTLLKRTLELFPNVEIWNSYGPTETTIGASSGKLRTNGPVHVGKPISNARIYILDREMFPVPVNVPGEIYIGGKILARGYIHDPKQTAEKFLPDPYANQNGARMYKTGDRGQVLPNGNIICLGRYDEQVKIRGIRIEPPEIETKLKNHPDIQEAAVVAVSLRNGEIQIHAHVAPMCDRAMITIIQQYLEKQLPRYMIPDIIYAHPKLPRTTGGKIDRQKLIYLSTKKRPKRKIVAPRSEDEKKLVLIWKKILQKHQISVHDSFFHVGGHSLLAAKLITEIMEKFQVEIPLRTLFEESTVSRMAKVIQMIRKSGKRYKSHSIMPQSRSPLPNSEKDNLQ